MTTASPQENYKGPRGQDSAQHIEAPLSHAVHLEPRNKTFSARGAPANRVVGSFATRSADVRLRSTWTYCRCRQGQRLHVHDWASGNRPRTGLAGRSSFRWPDPDMSRSRRRRKKSADGEHRAALRGEGSRVPLIV